MSRASAEEVAIGFSHSTCLPAAAAASTLSRCTRVRRDDVDRLDRRILRQAVPLVVAVDRVRRDPVLARRRASPCRACPTQRDDAGPLRLAEGRQDLLEAEPAEADDGEARRAGPAASARAAAGVPGRRGRASSGTSPCRPAPRRYRREPRGLRPVPTRSAPRAAPVSVTAPARRRVRRESGTSSAMNCAESL